MATNEELRRDFLFYLLEMAQSGYLATIFECFKGIEIPQPNKNFASFDIAARREGRSDPKDAELVKAEIQKRLQALKEANIAEQEILTLLFVLEFFYANNLPTPSELEARALEHLHACREEIVPTILDEIIKAFKNSLADYRAECEKFLLWRSNQNIDFQLRDRTPEVIAIRSAYTHFLADYVKFLDAIGVKQYGNLLILTETTLSEEGKKSIFGRVRELARACSGELNREELNKKLAAAQNDEVDDEFLNTGYGTDKDRSYYSFIRNGKIINTTEDFNLAKEVKTNNRRALLSSLAKQSLNAVFNVFKNKFSYQGFHFREAHLSIYEVLLDITNDDLYHVTVRCRSRKTSHNAEGNIDHYPGFYVDVDFDIKFHTNEVGFEVLEVVQESEKCHVMAIGDARHQYAFKVNNDVVKPNIFSANRLDYTHGLLEDFTKYICGQYDFERYVTGSGEKSREVYMETLENFSFSNFYYSEDWGAGFRKQYPQDCSVIEEFFAKHAAPEEMNYLEEGLKLFKFANFQLQNNPTDDAKYRYEYLKKFASGLIEIGLEKALQKTEKNENEVKKADIVYRALSELFSDPILNKNERFVKKYFSYGNSLLEKIYQLPSDKKKFYSNNFELTFDAVGAQLELKTVLENWKKPDLILATYLHECIDNPQKKDEICVLLSSLASADQTDAAKTLRGVLKLKDFDTSKRLKQNPGAILTGLILSNREIINNPAITGAVVVELLKPYPKLAGEVVQPSFWQSLFGMNASARFNKNDIKQLCKDHGHDVAKNIFSQPRRLFGRSLLDKLHLHGQDIAEIFLDSIFNQKKPSELLKALPKNKNIARKLIRLGNFEAKRRIYLALMTYDYHQTEKLLEAYPKLEADFKKIVPEFWTVQTIVKAIEKPNFDVKDYLDPDFSEKVRQVANILLSRCCTDGKLRTKVLENESLLSKLFEYADPLQLKYLIRKDVSLSDLEKLSHEAVALLEKSSQESLKKLEKKLELLEKNIGIFEAQCEYLNKYIDKLNSHCKQLEAKNDFLSKLIFNKENNELKQSEIIKKKLDESKSIISLQKQKLEEFKKQFESAKETSPAAAFSSCAQEAALGIPMTPVRLPVPAI